MEIGSLDQEMLLQEAEKIWRILNIAVTPRARVSVVLLSQEEGQPERLPQSQVEEAFAEQVKQAYSASFDLISDFVNYLRFASRLESELDSLKQELCLRTDFSPLDNFRCIDVEGRGYIRQSEFGMFLRDIDPTITSE